MNRRNLFQLAAGAAAAAFQDPTIGRVSAASSAAGRTPEAAEAEAPAA